MGQRRGLEVLVEGLVGDDGGAPLGREGAPHDTVVAGVVVGRHVAEVPCA